MRGIRRSGAHAARPARRLPGGRAATLAGAGLAVAAIVWAVVRFGGALSPSTPAARWAELLAGHSAAPPNVVLITIDTLRADRLSCYGAERVSTPAIDRLASEGVRFANAASTVPFTLPAHSSIMTGTYPPFHGVRENVGYALDASLPTLAEELAAGGWSTGGFVSAFVLDSRWGIARGFDTYYDDFDLESDETRNLGAVQRDGRETLAEALRWLDAGERPPFFLWLHLFEPHDPYTPPEPFASRHAGRPYDGEVAYADSIVGELRAGLEARGLLDATLLVLTADHGEGLGQHGEGFHGFFVYDSTVRVPLIVRLPGGELGGRVIEDVVSHVDLLPTLLEAAGRPAIERVHGRSLLALLMDAAPASAGPEASTAVYTESLYPLLHYGWAPLRTVRTARYKFIDAPQPELYDLVEDPREELNIFRRERQLGRTLEIRLGELRERIERPDDEQRPGAAAADLDPATLEQLRALGYVGGFGGAAEDEDDDRERADPKDRIQIHQMVMAAQSELGGGELERAERLLRTALDSDPSVVDAHQMLGAIEMRRGRPERAVTSFQAALEARSDHPAALFGLADAYRKLGRLEDALVGYDRILAADPDDNGALLASSNVLVELGRTDEATERLRAAARGDAGPRVLGRLGELLAVDGRTDEATPFLAEAIERGGDLAQPRFNLAVIYEEAGRIDEAVALYEEAIERAPRHYQAQFNLGRLLGQRGDLDRQQQLYEAAIESEPGFVRGYYFLAKLLLDRGGDLARAEEIVRAGLERDADNRAGPLGYYVLADILSRAGRPAESRQAAERGRRIERGL